MESVKSSRVKKTAVSGLVAAELTPILASIPLLHSAGMLSLPLLLGLVALLGCFMPPYYASQRTILPELVGEDERMMSQGNSLIEGGAAFSALIGPALAGLLIPFIGMSCTSTRRPTSSRSFSSWHSCRGVRRSSPRCARGFSPGCASC